MNDPISDAIGSGPAEEARKEKELRARLTLEVAGVQYASKPPIPGTPRKGWKGKTDVIVDVIVPSASVSVSPEPEQKLRDGEDWSAIAQEFMTGAG